MRFSHAIIFMLSVLVLQSCSTIQYGTTQKITIRSNPSSTIYLNDQVIGTTPMTYDLPRKTPQANIVLKAEGYKSMEYSLEKYKRGMGIGNSLLIVLGTSTLTTGLVTSNLSSRSPAFIGVGLAVTGLGVVSMAVDGATKANWSFKQDNIDVVLLRVPQPIIKDSCAPIVFSTAEFKISSGTRIGYDKMDNISNPILWQSTIGVNDAEIVSMLNNEMDVVGYNVCIPRNNKTTQYPQLNIESSVVEIGYDKDRSKYETGREPMGNGMVRISYSEKCISTCMLKIKWVLKNKNGKVLLEKVIQTYAKMEDCEGKVTIMESYKNNVFNLTHDPEFKALLKMKNIVADQPADLLDKITIRKPVYTNGPNYSVKENLKEIVKSVVTIETDIGHGSGFFISDDGIVLTSNHVIQGTLNIKVNLNNGISLPAKVIASNTNKDLAVLKIEGTGYKPLILNTSSEFDLGGEVYAIGTPSELDLGQTITKGIISGKRKIEENIYIQTDMSISPGNSGGPVINSKGEVIGVITAKIIKEGVEGIGFSIPAYLVPDYLNIQFE